MNEGRTPQLTAMCVAPAPYVTLSLAAELSGYTVRAMERKIERGDWLEGREWLKAPDGRRLVSLAGYTRWVESCGRTSC